MRHRTLKQVYGAIKLDYGLFLGISVYVVLKCPFMEILYVYTGAYYKLDTVTSFAVS